jgi:hypothetical protein
VPLEHDPDLALSEGRSHHPSHLVRREGNQLDEGRLRRTVSLSVQLENRQGNDGIRWMSDDAKFILGFG